MSTISEMIERAEPHVTYYVSDTTLDDLRQVWFASGRDDFYSMIVDCNSSCGLIEFRLSPRELYEPSSFARVHGSGGDEYTGNALIVGLALVGLCTVGYIALGWFLS